MPRTIGGIAADAARHAGCLACETTLRQSLFAVRGHRSQLPFALCRRVVSRRRASRTHQEDCGAGTRRPRRVTRLSLTMPRWLASVLVVGFLLAATLAVLVPASPILQRFTSVDSGVFLYT